jgi:hypothetical protein
MSEIRRQRETNEGGRSPSGDNSPARSTSNVDLLLRHQTTSEDDLGTGRSVHTHQYYPSDSPSVVVSSKEKIEEARKYALRVRGRMRRHRTKQEREEAERLVQNKKEAEELEVAETGKN